MGQTKNKVRDKLKQHKNDTIKKLQSTALARHAKDKGHHFDHDNVRILEREKILSDRLFFEMVHINKTDNCLNSRTDIDSLSCIYNNLLQIV